MEARSRWSDWAAATALVLVVGVAFSSSWHTTLSGDDFPGHVALLESILARLGNPDWLPLWTSDLSSGTSLLLPYLHPIASLLLLSPFTFVFGPELGLRVGDTVFLALAALTMFAWCRDLGATPLASFLGGLFYTLHPVVFVFLGRSGQVHQPVTMAVVPLVFLAFRRLAADPQLSRVALAALATAALALDMQRFWLLLPFVLLASLFTAQPGADSLLARVPSRVAWAGAAGVGSLLLLCFPVVPALLERPELMGHPPELLKGYRQSFALPHLLALLDRNSLLSAAVAGIHPARSGHLAGAAYQGLVPFSFVAVGTLCVLRGEQWARARSSLALLMCGATTSILLAMGTRGLLAQHAQILRGFVEENAGLLPWLALLIVFGAAAIGLMVTVIAARERWPAHRNAMSAGIVAITLLAASITPFMLLAQLPLYEEVRGPAHFSFPLLPFFLGTAASLVLPALSQRVPALALVAVATLLHGIDVQPYRDMLRPSREAPQEEAMRGAFQEIAALPPGRMVTSEDYHPLGESLGLLESERSAAWSWLAWSTRGTTSDLLRVGGFGPLEVARRGIEPAAAEFAARIFGLANIRFVVRAGPDAAAVPKHPAFVKRVDTAGIQIFENTRALAFAQFYPKIALLSGTTQQIARSLVPLAYSGVAGYVLSAGERPSKALRFDYVNGYYALSLAPGALPISRLAHAAPSPAPSVSPCEITSRREPEIAMRCGFSRPGYLVVAESWSPNWRVSVDGEPRDLYRLNLAFQGLRVYPGDEEIRIVHQMSGSVRASLFVSAIAWFALLAVALRARCPRPS